MQAIGLLSAALLLNVVAPTGAATPTPQETANGLPASCGPVTFVDVADEAGLSFVHVRGDSGEQYMVETMGSGAALFDVDRDGRLDLFLVNGAPLPGYTGEARPTNELYRNLGSWRFANVTSAGGVGDDAWGMGAAVADIDNDGFLDLYVTNFGSDVLYRNNGDGTFSEVSAAAGIDAPLWGASAAFGDVDEDGFLDLYVTHYVDFDLDNHKWCGDSVNDVREYCDPDLYNGVPDLLLRNLGDGTFVDVARQAGVYEQKDAKGLGVVFGDVDDDGDLDIYVANDGVRNFLFENLGNGHFREIGLMAGVAYNESGATEAGMGVDLGDIDLDGDLDIFVTHLDLETNTLYRNAGGTLFFDDTHGVGLASPSLEHVGFGTGFFDYDDDADLDLFVANGHILQAMLETRPGNITWAQPDLLLCNDGDGRFLNVGTDAGDYFAERKSSRGAAFGDVDNDGDVDILVSNSKAEPALLRHEGGGGNHRILIQTLGTGGNRDGIGARLTLTSGGRRQIREVRGGYSYLSHSDTRVAFGLGGAATVDRVDLRWPGGDVETYRDLEADRWYLIREGVGIVASAPLPR